jgi:serine/threonine protein kinase
MPDITKKRQDSVEYSPHKKTPVNSNKLQFESSDFSRDNYDFVSNVDSNSNMGIKTPFQLTPLDFDSLKKFHDSEANISLNCNHQKSVLSPNTQDSPYTMFDTGNVAVSKLKMPQVEKRYKRHFYESFVDSNSSDVLHDNHPSIHEYEASLQQPMENTAFVNKRGKNKIGLTRSAGHLNLSLNSKFQDKTLLPERVGTSTQVNSYASDDLRGSSQYSSGSKTSMTFHNSFNSSCDPMASNNQYSSNKSSLARKHNNKNLTLDLNVEQSNVVNNSLADSAKTENSILSFRNSWNHSSNSAKFGVSPLPTNDTQWSHPTYTDYSLNSATESLFNSERNHGDFDQTPFESTINDHEEGSIAKMRKIFNPVPGSQSKNPSFIDAKPDPNIFETDKLVSKFQSKMPASNERDDPLHASGLLSDNFKYNPMKGFKNKAHAVPDTPVKKPLFFQFNKNNFLQEPSINEDEHDTDDMLEEEQSRDYDMMDDASDIQNNSLKLSFHQPDLKGGSSQDIFKRSPTHLNNHYKNLRTQSFGGRKDKVYHKPNNSVTTITTISSNLSYGNSIDSQHGSARQSMILGNNLNSSLQKLTDDLYGGPSEESIYKEETPTKNKYGVIISERPYGITKNQFHTPQKNDNYAKHDKMDLLKSLKKPNANLQGPLDLEYKSVITPSGKFISPDAKHSTSILNKNNEDDIHYAYLITKFSKVQEIHNAGEFAKVFKVEKNISNSKSLGSVTKSKDVFAVKCMYASNSKSNYLNVLNEIHILQTISKCRNEYRNKYKNKKTLNYSNEPVMYEKSHQNRSLFQKDDFCIDESSFVFDFITSWKHDNGYYIISDYYENGTLNDFIQEQIKTKDFKFDDFRIWKIIVEVCHGLNFIHNHCSIAHLDLKPSNIFVTFEGSLKIGDFGLSTKLPLKGKHFENEGDREYIAPEIIRHSIYDFRADIFSLGLIVIELACNVVLPDNGKVWQRLRSGNISDLGKISSTEINKFLNESTEDYSSFSNKSESKMTPLLSASNFIGTSKLDEIERNTGKLIPAWVPKFLIDGMSLEKVVKWMIEPDYTKRPTSQDILLTDECEYVGKAMQAGSVVFEGDFGPKLELL